MVYGTRGYREEAAAFIERTENVRFDIKHQHSLHLLPTSPSRILDIGAGSGADAAHLAVMGHTVLAVEPTDELRLAGMALHPSAQITWIDDSLPDLGLVRAGGQTFDFVLLSGVWMHLSELDREAAFPNIARLMNPGARLVMSLRHGPVPPTKLMFEVSAEETIYLAESHALTAILNVQAESIQPANRQAGVTWTHLGFERQSSR